MQYFTALDFTSITSHIHNWVLFSLCLHPFSLSGVIPPLISSSILAPTDLGSSSFQCHIFLPFHTVHGILKARILKRLAIKKHSRDRSKIWLLRWLSDEEPTCQCRRHELILGWGRCPEEANGNPLQYSCLGNPMDRGAWWAIVHGVTKSQIHLRDLKQ